MRKLVSTLMAVTLMLVSATACAERITPSKNYVTKKVNVGSFNAISTSSSVDVIYTQSSGGQTCLRLENQSSEEYGDAGRRRTAEDGIYACRT